MTCPYFGRPKFAEMTVTDITQMRDGYGVTASGLGISMWWMESEKPEYKVGETFQMRLDWRDHGEEK